MIRRLSPHLPIVLALAMTTATACSPLFARDLVGFDIVDRDTGQTLPEYGYRGQDWIAGVPGHHYSVRLTNTTSERVLVVLSVDGVNAISGQTASGSQAGYVLDPRETADIAGWRKSLDDVAQFVFTDLPDSYAARTGRPDNIGVVGIAVFRERQVRPRPQYAPPISQPHAESRSDKSSAGNMAKSAPSASSADRQMVASEAEPQHLGTGHGEREWAPVGQTEFVRASQRPQQVEQLRYDGVGKLVAMGVIPRRYGPTVRNGPSAFPNGFVADPPRW
jgi:hypothetical protein